MLGEKERKKWKFSDVGAWLRNAFMATLRGEFLLRFQASKYFIHIIYKDYCVRVSDADCSQVEFGVKDIQFAVQKLFLIRGHRNFRSLEC